LVKNIKPFHGQEVGHYLDVMALVMQSTESKAFEWWGDGNGSFAVCDTVFKEK
jgi:hypothetical protein